MPPSEQYGLVEHSSQELQRCIRGIVQTVRQPLLVLDWHATIVFANRAFCETFRIHPNQVECHSLFEIENGLWDIRAFRLLIEDVLPKEGTADDFEVIHHFPCVGRRVLMVNASRLRATETVPELILLGIEDITARKEAEKTLQESETRYRSLFEFSPLPTWVADRETFRFLAVNQAAIDQYGYSEEEFLNLTVLDIRYSDEVPHVANRFSSPTPSSDLSRHRKKDGTIIDVEIRRHPLVFQGRDARLVVATDISERNRAEQELENKTRQILTTWESMTDAFFTVDLEWRFTYLNAQGEKLLLRTRDDLIGKNLWEEFPEAMKLQFYPEEQRAMAEQVPVVFEEFFPPLNSWFEVHAYPSPIGLSVYFRDITERRRDQAALKKSLDLLQAVTEGTTDAVFVKDRDGCYLMINSAGARIMGAPAEEIIGQDDTAFFDADMVLRIRENDLYTMESEEASTYEETGTSGGITRAFLATKAPYRDMAGNVMGIVGISRDITEQKRLQNQLAQSERLAAMGELVAGVAHELNNPLAAISGHAQLLQRCSDPMVREDAETIQAMTDRAARIVRSLLAFSRHADNADRRPVFLRPLIDGTLEMIRYKLRKSNVEVVLDLVEPDIAPTVVSGQIEQVLLNLLVNAEHALRSRIDDRRVNVSTRLFCQGGEEWAVLCVEDNGSGISRECLSRIFDPFFTTKPQGEGTGLGLSICHGIAEEHGGRLEVSSMLGVGTTFTLWLPLVVKYKHNEQ